MNKIPLIISLVFSTTVFASGKTKSCILKDMKRLEMNLISSNVANVNTTSTRKGGPYKRKDLVCNARGACEISESKEITIKYMPGHPDAHVSGYVAFPAVDVYIEMEKLIAVHQDYERLEKECLNE